MARRERKVFLAVVAPFQAFFRLEAAGGLVLMATAVTALAWANSPFARSYEAIFHTKIEMKLAGYGIDWTVHHFTNDALMTLFFAVAGLEIKRELTHGELRTWTRATLPLVAALGGMIVPAAIYLALNPKGPERMGWAVPMATDIAFALGCLSLVKSRVPPSLFVFLTALAIFDDLGAIVVIAFFYGGGVNMGALAAAGAVTAVLVGVGRAGVQQLWPYVVLGLLLWVALLGAGVHATLAGVAVGLSIPSTSKRAPRDVLDDLDHAIGSLREDCDRLGAAPDGTIAAIERHIESVQSPLDRAMHALHGAVAYGIVPLFALANAGVELGGVAGFGSSVTMGALLGLVLGKPLGVGLATLLAVKAGVAPRPSGASTLQIVGVSCIAGIGFTMSLLVGSLAFTGMREFEDASKLGVLSASLASALLGLGLLWFSDKTEAAVRADEPRAADA
jgi:NhaA family Na+:H+ antiporter